MRACPDGRADPTVRSIRARGQISGTIVATLAALALIATPTAQAAPPSNDQAGGAELLSGSSFPVLSSTWDITEATYTNDPVPVCQTDDDHGIWFKITPDQTATYRIWAAAEGPTNTTVDDTVLAVYTSAGGAAGPFTSVACDDDSATNENFQSLITTSLTGGTQYYIYVSQFGFGDPVQPPPNNLVQIKIDRIATTPPANDTPAGAEILSAASFPVLSGTYDITDATLTGDPPSPSCQASVSRSIWFKVTPDQNATYRIWAAAEGPTATTVDDTVMAAYTSAGGAAGPFTEVACDDDTASNEANQSIITTQLNAGTEYWIVVWKFGATAPTAGNQSVQIKVDRLAGTTDSDLDGVLDGSDNCPNDANPAQENHDPDALGDACDPDDDNDTVLDGADDCPTGGAAGADTDGDGCKDAGEDSNDDDDALADDADQCDLIAAATASGCPAAARTLTLSYSSRKKTFKGRLSSDDEASCAAAQEVTILRKVSGDDKEIGTPTTDGDGKYKLAKRARRGKYYSTVDADVIADLAECQPAASPIKRVG